MKIALKTFKITIEYDGSLYHGWQRQKKHKTIQGEIESALTIITGGKKVMLVGSGRTDAGVHAFGQVASFKVRTKLSSFTFQKGLNKILSDDISIKSCEVMFDQFHARFSAKRKTYTYYIVNSLLKPAIGRRFFWHIKKQLDLKAMKVAACYFLGKHSFKTFESTGSPRKYDVRIISKSFLKFSSNNLLTYTVEANGFLKFMVRNIVGTLVDVGLGKIEVEKIPELIKLRDRSKAGITAPPNGLFLVKVDY